MTTSGAAKREQAEQSVAARFSRLMNATTSPWGMLTDPPIVAVTTAPTVVALLAALRLEASPAVVTGLEVLAALPLGIALVLSIALRGARARVVDWLATLPFPVENLNAVLNGLGESIEVTFSGAVPLTRELNEALDKVSPDAFVLKAPDMPQEGQGGEGKPAAPAPGLVEIRLGVVESKRNPAASNHQRFQRVRALATEVLVPMNAKYPIAEVRVK